MTDVTDEEGAREAAPSDSADADTAEIEHEGRRYRIPAVLKRLLSGAKPASADPKPTPVPASPPQVPAAEDPHAAALRERAARLAEVGRVLSRDIEGWGPDLAARLVAFAGSEFGVTPDEASQITDARIWKLLHRAHLGDEAVRAREAGRRQEAAQQTRPAETVSGGREAPNRTSDELATGEWMRRRREEKRKER